MYIGDFQQDYVVLLKTAANTSVEKHIGTH